MRLPVVLEQGVGHLGQLEAVVGCVGEVCDVRLGIGKLRQAARELVQVVEREDLRIE
ncbi:hypothetical protein D9M73_244800 [compost metagenome]